MICSICGKECIEIAMAGTMDSSYSNCCEAEVLEGKEMNNNEWKDLEIGKNDLSKLNNMELDSYPKFAHIDKTGRKVEIIGDDE